MNTEVVAAYLRHEIEEWIRAGGTVADLARSVGVSPPYVSQLRSRVRSVGLQAMQGFAKHLGVSLDELGARADAWVRAQPAPAVPAQVEGAPVARLKIDTSRYPNFAKAAEEESTALAQAMDEAFALLKHEGDPEVHVWREQIRAKARELSAKARFPVEAQKAETKATTAADERMAQLAREHEARTAERKALLAQPAPRAEEPVRKSGLVAPVKKK